MAVMNEIHSRHFSRRTLLGGAGFLALASAFPISKSLLSDANAASGKYVEPKRILSSGGALKLTLEAAPAMVPFNTSKRWALLYNKQLPAPTLVAKPGDTLKITVKNSTGFMTNLHTHGLHVSPLGKSDNPFIAIANGKSFDYEIKIPKNHTGGTYWYHPHHHMMVAEQVNAGLAGTIIIEDTSDSLAHYKASSDRVIQFSDPKIGTDSSVLNATMMDSMHGRSGQYLLINGAINPTITSKSGQVERWRLVNTCVSRYVTFSVDNADLIVLATDAGRLETPLKTTSMTMTPGQRYEVVIAARKSGALVVRDGQKAIATLSTSALDTSAFLAKSADAIPVLRAPSKSRTLKIVGAGMMQGMSGMGNGGGHEMAFTFDGQAFDPTSVNQRVKFGTVEDWVITNESSMDHPFHIHAWNFQIVDRGDGKALPGWRDTVNVPTGMSVRIRIDFADFKGKTVYHCHILDHEDAGMMGIVKVS